MNCLTCQSGYYLMSNNASQCYSSSSVPSNYLLINYQFQSCYSSCASCNIIGNLSNPGLYCASNYYPLFIDSTKCYSTSTIQNIQLPTKLSL